MMALLSSEAVTMRLPSGLYAALLTHLPWLVKVFRRLPLAASQTMAVVSAEAVTMELPSGL